MKRIKIIGYWALKMLIGIPTLPIVILSVVTEWIEKNTQKVLHRINVKINELESK